MRISAHHTANGFIHCRRSYGTMWDRHTSEPKRMLAVRLMCSLFAWWAAATLRMVVHCTGVCVVERALGIRPSIRNILSRHFIISFWNSVGFTMVFLLFFTRPYWQILSQPCCTFDLIEWKNINRPISRIVHFIFLTHSIMNLVYLLIELQMLYYSHISFDILHHPKSLRQLDLKIWNSHLYFLNISVRIIDFQVLLSFRSECMTTASDFLQALRHHYAIMRRSTSHLS